ncbi:MAG: hypothetical protein J5934_02050 [Succinivibrio sp.]|nr:hypothetical protein [Succinivibrio sp.]
MDFELTQVEKADLADFKKDMQQAFQTGAEKEYGRIDTEILPEADINRSL